MTNYTHINLYAHKQIATRACSRSHIVARLCAVTMLVFAPIIAEAAALDQFRSFVASTKAAKGEFTQRQVKMMDGTAKVSNVSSGSFSFARPGKFIWTYQKPYEQLLQADGDKLYIFDKDLNQVTIKKLG